MIIAGGTDFFIFEEDDYFDYRKEEDKTKLYHIKRMFKK
ncbi:hypothetical protein CHCC20335_4714 [Bacillus paralicheniformis]|nr:hypothetical protein CHCC20335_4714 [Bacillus paralicheniformis]